MMMDMTELATRIHDSTYSVEVLHRRLGLLQQVLEYVVFRVADSPVSLAERYHAALTEQVSEPDQSVLVSWGSDWLAGLTVDSVTDSLTNVRETVLAYPTFTVYLPVQVCDGTLAPLALWCRSEITSPLFLSVTVDPAVVGGCAFVYQDTYYDYSLAARVRRQPESITRIIEEYANE